MLELYGVTLMCVIAVEVEQSEKTTTIEVSAREVIAD
jgi:hypothetical protein